MFQEPTNKEISNAFEELKITPETESTVNKIAIIQIILPKP